MNKYLVFILTVFVALLVAGVVMPENDMAIIKPLASAGQYGTGRGQIDTPVSVRVDVNDNVYVLQHVHTGGARFKSVVTVYDRNLTYVRSFDVLKKSMVDVGWESAGGGYYYDNLASAFDIDAAGRLFILCGWDVVVYSADGRYQYQFPVSSFMGWIDLNNNNETQFYYPKGLAISNDGYVVITSGGSENRHELIFIFPEGRLFTKIETPIKRMSDLFRDRDGNLYVVDADGSTVHAYDPTVTKETDLPLDFGGTYAGCPASLAFFKSGNITASANGLFVYDRAHGLQAHFVDNNASANNTSWGRPIATNSSDYIIMLSGAEDRAKTPQPINVYRYDGDTVVGTPEDIDFCSASLAAFGAAVSLYFCARRF